LFSTPEALIALFSMGDHQMITLQGKACHETGGDGKCSFLRKTHEIAQSAKGQCPSQEANLMQI
jgi:hypothetical protein